MTTASIMISRIQASRLILLDILALVVVFFTPALSHLLSFPLYLIEPMRIMVILAVLHTHRVNALILAISLPIFSFAVSAHPVFLKMLLISAELSLNVWLFLLLKKYIRIFPAMALSILVSKTAYYLMKFTIVSFGILQMSIFSTSLWIQLITTLIFSGYAYFVFKTKETRA